MPLGSYIIIYAPLFATLIVWVALTALCTYTLLFLWDAIMPKLFGLKSLELWQSFIVSVVGLFMFWWENYR